MSNHRPVKIRLATYRRLQHAVADITQLGWHAVGTDRKDPPTLGAVMDQAIVLLEERIAHARTRKG